MAKDGKRYYLVSGEYKTRLDQILAWLENLEVIGGTWMPSSKNAKLKIGDGTGSSGEEEAVSYDPQVLPATLSTAGDFPTAAEVTTAIQSAYTSASLTPKVGDIIYMTEFHYLIVGLNNSLGSGISLNDIFRVDVTVNSESYTALQIGPNRLY